MVTAHPREATLLCGERHLGQATHVGRVESFDPGSVDLVVREALNKLPQRDPRLKSSKRCTQAEVNAVAKGQCRSIGRSAM